MLNNDRHTDYYVYLHRRKDNGDVFYIGKGRLNRAYVVSSRNARWFNIYKQSGFIVEYYSENLTNEQALTAEQEAYDKYKHFELTNAKKVGDERLDYDKIDWSGMVYYDATSPTCLRWLVKNSARNPSSIRNPGEVAGGLRKVKGKRYHGQLKIQKKNYAIHRIVWILHYGSIPIGQVVNHIDCDPTNNKIENLELCTLAENSNRKFFHKRQITRGNTQTGYYFIKRGKCNRTGTPYTLAIFYMDNGKSKTKTFRHNVYPPDIAIEFAILWRESMFDEYSNRY